MKSIFSSRRNKSPHNNEEAEKKEAPFFSKENKTPFFNTTDGKAVQTKLKVGQPGDKYEKEADSMADAVVNKTTTKPDIQNKEISSIQRLSLATPIEDEKLGTAEQRMEKDKLIQEKPEVQKMGEPEEEEGMISKMENEEEEGMVNKMEGEEEEEETLQTKSKGSTTTASSGLTQQIKSKSGKGKTMAKNTRAEMEASFDRNFSGVNIHTGQDAVKMNKELGAQAFTHGQDVYFNSGKYNPDSSDGKRLLAHELTHVVQQNKGQLNRKQQNPESNLIQQLSCGTSKKNVGRRDPTKKNPLDKRAESILAIASDDTKTNTEKGAEIVTQIICRYFPKQASIVDKVVYKADLNGLDTTSKGKGKSTKGIIGVGDYFTKKITKKAFARRVTQVWHEIRHIQQYRSGLSGHNNKSEREFLAFSENATSEEFLGTGSINYSTRYSLIDAALGHFYCLTKDKQKIYKKRKKELLSKRKKIEKSGRLKKKVTIPTTCKK